MLETEPGLQLKHSLAPAELEYDPAEHPTHADPPDTEYVPLSQATQPALEFDPASEENVPPSHAAHAVDP